jgi:molybdenum cofactor biosynthesis protein B
VAAVTRVPWPGSGAGQGARSSGAASASGFGAESTMGHEEHRKEGPRAVRVAVITASDTRSEAEDTSGAFLKQAATAAGHEVVHYRVVKDDPAAIRAALEEARQAGAQVLLVNGGTGISPRDGTYEAVTGLLEKRLNGFGELFRMLSWSEIGSAAMLSRAVGGVWRGCALFSMPGSTAAVRLAFEKLIGPELSHLVRELSKGAPGGR